jgi:hypothetical protein
MIPLDLVKPLDTASRSINRAAGIQNAKGISERSIRAALWPCPSSSMRTAIHEETRSPIGPQPTVAIGRFVVPSPVKEKTFPKG